MPARPLKLRRVRVALWLVHAVLAAAPAFAAAAPANDNCADAAALAAGDRVTGTLVDATREAGEPATRRPLIDHTVW